MTTCTDACLHLQWWLGILPSWSGTSQLDIQFSNADASGNKGWGAYWAGRWLQAEWSPDQAMQDIIRKELYAGVCAVNTWGHNWAKKILFHCDNNTVVRIWNKGSKHCREIMTLVRMLHFCATRYNMHVMITH